MNMPSKKFMIPMAALALILAGSYGVAQVSAASDTTGTHTSIVQKLADTFHLDKSKVQAVFDAQHQENQANHEKTYEDRLSRAVTDGKLTADQKVKVLAEHNTLKAELEAAMAKTDKTARRTAMEKVRTEATQWAKDNSIDAKWLMPGRGFGPGHHGFGKGHDTSDREADHEAGQDGDQPDTN